MSLFGSESVWQVHQQEFHNGGRKKVPQAFVLGIKALALGLEAEEEAILEKRKAVLLEVDYLCNLVMTPPPICLPVRESV